MSLAALMKILEGIIDTDQLYIQCIYAFISRQRLEEFMQGFGVISLKLKEMYQMITLGGRYS